jgi:hypothetical protein
MRKLLLSGLILTLFIAHVFAQTAEQKGQTMEQNGMLGTKEMNDRIAGMMRHMAEMMGKMPNMIKEEMPPPDIRGARFEIMKDLAKQMLEMSKIMEIGTATEKEMKSLQDRMVDMEKKMSEVEAKE